MAKGCLHSGVQPGIWITVVGSLQAAAAAAVAAADAVVRDAFWHACRLPRCQLRLSLNVCRQAASSQLSGPADDSLQVGRRPQLPLHACAKTS